MQSGRMFACRARGKHQYFGRYNSRGKRFLSKIHKGINSGNLAKAFAEVEALNKGD